MPNPMEILIDKATDGQKTSENWLEIMEIVDMIETQPNGAKETLRYLVKRLKNRDPHVALLALTVLDACVMNGKKKFHLEVASRFFDEEARQMLQNTYYDIRLLLHYDTGFENYPRPVIEKLCQLIKKWSENEFKSDPALTIIPTLYNHIRNTNPDYITEAILGNKAPVSQPAPAKTDSTSVKQQEEEELAKAIALSLQEEEKKKKTSAAFSALYPSMSDTGSSNAIYATVQKPKEPRKVRAMYDFEAVEDNELTFKAGEILHVLDDSDPNWWKGSNNRGEGLFPTNFVTSDLNWEPENEYATGQKKQASDTSSASSGPVEQKPVEIDEALIDRTLNMIHDADPTGERADPADLLTLEDQCNRMWPLIDTELQKTDRLQSSLDELSVQLTDALSMYDSVMKEQAAQLTSGAYAVQPMYYAHQAVGGPTQVMPGSQQYPPQAFHQGPVDPSAMYAGQHHGFQSYAPNAAKLNSAGGAMPSSQPTYSQHTVDPNVYAPSAHNYPQNM